MRKYIYLVLSTIFLQFFIGCNFSPGSYPYVEKYTVSLNKDTLIELVKEFKKNNPEFVVPADIGLQDGQSADRDDHWYHVYFYYKKENKIVYSWLREDTEDKTDFALVGINNGLELGNWKLINKDFTPEENSLEKKKFEDLILNRIIKIRN